MTPASIRSIFINLPVKDIARTRAFWESLGFAINEQFSDDTAICLVLKENEIYAMLLSTDKFQTFTPRPVADGTTSQVLLSVDVGSRERVHEVMQTALAHGATRYLQPEDMGWMMYDRFVDPDGHQWEIAFMDETQRPQS